MVSINWSLMNRIGLKMGASAMAVLPLVAGTPPTQSGARVTQGPVAASKVIKHDANHASPNMALKAPLLGIFTTAINGESILYSTDQNLQLSHGLIYIAENRQSGKVEAIKACPQAVLLKKITAGTAVPGEFHDSHGSEVSFAFEGTIDAKVCSDGLSAIGILLQPESAILTRDKNVMRVKVKNRIFTIKHHFSSEGYRAECVEEATRKTVANFYYYLGYELDL